MVAAPAASALPSACRLVPIAPDGSSGAVSLSVVVQTPAEGKGEAQLVFLGSLLDGRVYLGALTDRGGRVREWLEIWVQVISGLDGSIIARETTLTNASLDVRWRRMTAALLASDPEAGWETGWETRHPAPVWIDVAESRAVHAVDSATNELYSLCTDDAALIAAGLEPYSESLHRYLGVKDQPGAGFVVATTDAPKPAQVRELRELLPSRGKVIPFNPEGGLLFVRRLAPLEWRQYAGILSGQPFQGLAAGRPPVKLGGPFAALDRWDGMQQEGRYLFAQRSGRAGRFLETLHLKLQIFAGMMRCLRTTIAGQQRPLLCLSSDSFRVGFADPAGDLPVLWTARVALTEGAGAVSLPTPADGVGCFRPAAALPASIFRPARLTSLTSGRGELRIRAVRAMGKSLAVEGTISASELTTSSASDRIRLRVPIPGGPVVELWGTIDSSEGLVRGEARFRTSSLELGPDALAAVTRAEGFVLPGTAFETVPVLSSPCDLYSLGVLGVELFLAPGGDGLAIALDETLSLARALDANPAASAGEQAAALARSDARWVRSLGPQRHGHGPLTAEEAFSFVPMELWWGMVSLLARLFPGAGALSYQRDLGDAPPRRLEAVFDQPLADLDNVILRSRSLLFGDWMANREVAQILQRLR